MLVLSVKRFIRLVVSFFSSLLYKVSLSSYPMENYLYLLLVNPFCYGAIFLLVIYLGGKPKKRNGLYGYRTFRSMKSEESFKLANELFFPRFKMVSWGMVVLGLNFPLISKSLELNLTLGLLTLTLGLGLMIYQIERKLKKKFG